MLRMEAWLLKWIQFVSLYLCVTPENSISSFIFIYHLIYVVRLKLNSKRNYIKWSSWSSSIYYYFMIKAGSYVLHFTENWFSIKNKNILKIFILLLYFFEFLNFTQNHFKLAWHIYVFSFDWFHWLKDTEQG